MIEYVVSWVIVAAMNPIADMSTFREAADWLMTIEPPPSWVPSLGSWS